MSRPHSPAGAFSILGRKNALSMPEDVVRIKYPLDLPQAGEVRAPIGLRPILQIKVAIVDVGRARHIGPRRRIDVTDVRKFRCGLRSAAPLGIVLNAESGAGAMR